MRATNLFTGKRQEVVLMSPSKLAVLDQLAIPSYPELRADLNRAFSGFTKIQQRVLARVLIQGQSLETATLGLSKTRRWWANWFTNTALPKLREKLADYYVNGKVVVN